MKLFGTFLRLIFRSNSEYLWNADRAFEEIYKREPGGILGYDIRRDEGITE